MVHLRRTGWPASDLTKWPTVNTALFFFNGISFLLPKKRVNISPGLSWHDSLFFCVKVFVGIPIDQYHFGCGLSFFHPRCSRQDLCLFKGTHFGHILDTTYRKHFQNLLRNQWWIIMNYLYMGVSMGLYSIHTIPRKWSIRLSLLLGPSSTMIPALNLPQVFITEEDRPKLKCHWLGDRIIDHCLQINGKADLKFWWGPKHPKPIAAGRSEIWHTQHPRNTSWLCHGVSAAIDCNWECTERPNATGPFWMIPHCFRWVIRRFAFWRFMFLGHR